MTKPVTTTQRRRNKRILLTLGVLVATASFNPAHAQGADLGQLSSNPYAPDATANPYSSAGSPHSATSVRNPYGQYGSPYSNQSATNPNATDAPELYDEQGHYRGKLSTNPYDPESVSNPYGGYGSEYSADSINNPYGAGSEYRTDSPNNPYGVGMKIVAGGGRKKEGDDDVAAPADSPPTYLPKPLPALKAPMALQEVEPAD